MEKTLYQELFEAHAILVGAGMASEEAMKIVTKEFIERQGTTDE